MQTVFDLVLAAEPAPGAYRWVLRAAAAYLIGLALLIVIAPGRARVFLGGFAGTLAANTLEGVLRFVAGVALTGFALQIAAPRPLVWAGLFIVASAAAMVLLPGIHRRYARWAVPLTLRMLPVYAAGALGLGAGLFWLTAGYAPAG